MARSAVPIRPRCTACQRPEIAPARTHTQVGRKLTIQVQNQALKDGLKNWKPGDKVIAEVTGPKNNEVLQDLRPQTLGIGRRERFIVALTAAFGLLAFTYIASSKTCAGCSSSAKITGTAIRRHKSRCGSAL